MPPDLTSPADRESQLARALTWRYAMALVFVGLLATAAWLSLGWVIKAEESIAAVVNVSGRQRMLSQRIALFAQLTHHGPATVQAAYRSQLADAVALMTRSHHGLTQGDTSMGLPADMSAAARAAYFASDGGLDAAVRSYLAAVQRLLAPPGPGVDHAADLRFVTEQASGPLLDQLDAMVRLYQQEGEATVTRLAQAETGFWLLTLLLLTLEAGLIFHPFVRHVHGVIAKLKASTQALQEQQANLAQQVTERTQALQARTDALTQSEERFRQISAAAQDSILILDAQGQVVWANPSAWRLIGTTPAATPVHALLGLVLPGRRARAAARAVQRFRQQHGSAGLGQRLELTIRHSDGTARVVDVALSAMLLGAVWHAVVIARDVTQRRAQELDLRVAAVAFESQLGMFITDAQARILRVNQAFTHITGYTAAEALGQTPRLLQSGRHDAGFYYEMRDNLARDGIWQGEVWNRRKDGESYPEWLTITVVRNARGRIEHYVAAFSDISEQKAAERQIRHLAYYDPLTDLPNRRLLTDRIERALLASQRHLGLGAALFVDLDEFKLINDTLGHAAGDALLQQVARRLRAQVREADTVARIGGDEFVVLIEDLAPFEDDAAVVAEALAQKIMTALREPLELGTRSPVCHASIGITLFSGRHDTVEDILQRADLAMYHSKSAGRDTARFFDPTMQQAALDRSQLEAALRQALDQQAFELYFQPQVDASGAVTGAEALLRWNRPGFGVVAPGEFIHLAEQTRLILPIGAWVLDAACAQVAAWQGTSALASITVAVNVSPVQFAQDDFVTQVHLCLKRHGVRSARIKLELTESLLLHDVERTIEKMHALSALGLSLSLDDFGTGYSSLSYLSRLPLSQIKIDQSFVRGLSSQPQAASICTATIELAHSLGLQVVAEGVETAAEVAFLTQTNHCDYLQGYLYSRPLPAPAFAAWVQAQPHPY